MLWLQYVYEGSEERIVWLWETRRVADHCWITLRPTRTAINFMFMLSQCGLVISQGR